MVIIAVDTAQRLAGGQTAEVLGLAANATREDDVAPLSEQVLLAIRDDLTAARGTIAVPPHFLVYAGKQLAGYAHCDPGPTSAPGPSDTSPPAGMTYTAEVVVDPSQRRRGVGSTLVHALEEAAFAGARAPHGHTLNLWSHGDLPGARVLALSRGYSMVRELWQMSRSLGPDAAALPGVSLPDGFRTRHFVVGQDEEAWLRVNARAFVDHPEQGRMTRHDLDQRIAQPWFEATGLLLIEDTRGPRPVLAASHWTKVVAAEEQGNRPALQRVGEVYVVGVDPAYQGLGLGRAVTVLGLAHLREQGLAEAMLYVDADNRAAVATYSGLFFTRSAADTMYSRTVHQPV